MTMGLIGGRLGYALLRRISPGGSRTGCPGGDPYENRSKLNLFFGQDFWDDITGKTVIDFGCGYGTEVIEMAKHGASRVIGIDIREKLLDVAAVHAAKEGVENRCTFTTEWKGKADTIVSVDAFEHFDDPGHILELMSRLLAPKGVVWAVFGPPWYHPYRGYLFSVFPWAHLVFTENSLIKWRSDFKTDGAKRFSEVEGGLNQMTIKRFKRLVSSSPFRFDHFDPIPIRRLRYISNPIIREFVTSSVRCRLVLR